MRKLGLLWAAFLLVGTSLCWAQSGPDSVCEVNVTKVKPGAARQFEAARKKHNEFHKAENDKHAIVVWSISTGPQTGDYLTVTCGLAWKDMDGHDAFDQRDEADISVTMAPAIASNETSYWILRTDLGPSPQMQTLPKMQTIFHYFVKPGGLEQFTTAVKRINAAIEKSKYPVKPRSFYSLANGGEGPHFVLVTDRASWADMQGPEQSLADMLKQVYGDDDKTLQNLRDALDHTASEMHELRADLSYMPAK